MDPTRNPYSPGAGSPPPALVGRDAELETVRIAIERLRLGRFAKSVILTGLRGVGKTVLLQEFRRLGQSRDGVCQPLEASEGIRFPLAMSELVRKVVLRLSPAQNVADQAKRALGVLKSFQLRWNLPDGGDVTVGLDPVPGWADSGLLDEDLAGLFTGVGRAARERGKGALITVDEVQYLKRKDLGALIVGLHQVPAAVDELDTGFFRVRVDRTTDSEREYLVAMASLGKGPYSSGRVAATMGKDTPGVGPVRDKLIKKGLCYSPRWGEIDFTVPLFDDFVRRRLRVRGAPDST